MYKKGKLQLPASDEQNKPKVIGIDVLKRALGLDEIEARLAALESKPAARKQPAAQDRMARAKEDRKQ